MSRMNEPLLDAAPLGDALGAGLAATVRRTGASVGALYLLGRGGRGAAPGGG
ncbi:hypothetical protein ACVW19_000627 [Streptomyces sp. TE5632]